MAEYRARLVEVSKQCVSDGYLPDGNVYRSRVRGIWETYYEEDFMRAYRLEIRDQYKISRAVVWTKKKKLEAALHNELQSVTLNKIASVANCNGETVLILNIAGRTTEFTLRNKDLDSAVDEIEHIISECLIFYYNTAMTGLF